MNFYLCIHFLQSAPGSHLGCFPSSDNFPPASWQSTPPSHRHSVIWLLSQRSAFPGLALHVNGVSQSKLFKLSDFCCSAQCSLPLMMLPVSAPHSLFICSPRKDVLGISNVGLWWEKLPKCLFNISEWEAEGGGRGWQKEHRETLEVMESLIIKWLGWCLPGCIFMSKLIKSYALNMCSLLCQWHLNKSVF